MNPIVIIAVVAVIVLAAVAIAVWVRRARSPVPERPVPTTTERPVAVAEPPRGLAARLAKTRRAIGDRVAAQAKEAIETFKSKFTEEDIARMKRGVEKVGGFMKGFAEGLKDFLETHAPKKAP